MSRKGLEFSKKVKLEIFQRAGGPGAVRCEGCGLPPKGSLFDYDHTVEINQMPEKMKERFRKEGVPAEYGQLLCKACHTSKTSRSTSERSHGKRIIAKAARATNKKSSFATSRDRRYKKTIDGRVIDRETGKEIKR